MILSRIKPAVSENTLSSPSNAARQLPTLYNFIDKRDYLGALTLLEFEQSIGKATDKTERWIGYCAFHLGDYKMALSTYESLQNSNPVPEDNAVNLACCYFFLGMYSQVEKILEEVPDSRLKIRLQFHLSQKLGDESRINEYHSQLVDVVEDQLSLASIHYLRAHYNEAIDIYKRILQVEANRHYLALNVYIALCYYKLDFYDLSQEVLGVYLQKYPDSVIAVNLKACNNFRLYNGKAAEAEIKTLLDQNAITSFSFGQDLLRHNLAVFRMGKAALQVLPPLVDVIPEARLNLVVYYLKQNDYQECFELIKDLQPQGPHEYILKGVVNAAYGQENGLKEYVKTAQKLFEIVGSSSSECDTIPGRLSMASSYFLQRKFRDVQLYLGSIKSYYFNDDSFNFNYAQTKVALNNFKDAEELFMLVQNEKLQNDYVYVSQLARCFIMNRKPQSAWELYLKMETSSESLSLLQLIANDCYRMGQFWHAAKAFDMLERLDPLPEYWEGKRGACMGVLQLIIAGRQSRETLTDVVQLLRNSANVQVENIIATIKKWAKDERIVL